MEPAAETLAAAKRGDEASWRAIVEELGPPIVGYARAKGVPDPEDLMQEVFMAMAAQIARFTGPWSGFRSWAFTIAHHRIVDRQRHRSRAPHLVSVEAAGPTPDTSPGPEEAVVARQEVDSLLTAISTLSAIERDVILLRVVGELSSEEVGAILGKRPGTIRVIQSRAVARLKGLMHRP